MIFATTANFNPVNGSARRLIEAMIETIEVLPRAILPVWTDYSVALDQWDRLIGRYPSPLALLAMDDEKVTEVRDEMVEAASKLNATSSRLLEELKAATGSQG